MKSVRQNNMSILRISDADQDTAKGGMQGTDGEM